MNSYNPHFLNWNRIFSWNIWQRMCFTSLRVVAASNLTTGKLGESFVGLSVFRKLKKDMPSRAPSSTLTSWPERRGVELGILNRYLRSLLPDGMRCRGVSEQLSLPLLKPRTHLLASSPTSAFLFTLIEIRLRWTHHWWLEDSFAWGPPGMTVTAERGRRGWGAWGNAQGVFPK